MVVASFHKLRIILQLCCNHNLLSRYFLVLLMGWLSPQNDRSAKRTLWPICRTKTEMISDLGSDLPPFYDPDAARVKSTVTDEYLSRRRDSTPATA